MIKDNQSKPLNNLKSIRNAEKISITKMASILNISNAFYCQIERGQRRLSYNMAVRIAQVFNTKPDKIFYNDFN